MKRLYLLCLVLMTSLALTACDDQPRDEVDEQYYSEPADNGEAIPDPDDYADEATDDEAVTDGDAARDETTSEATTEPDNIADARSYDDADELTEVEARCDLTMGFESWVPYQYQDVGGEVRGLDVAIASEVAERMDCVLHAHQDHWMYLLEDLAAGDVDILMGASRTESREAYARFSDPYRQERFVLFIRSNEGHRYDADSITDFVASGHQVGVVDEYYYGGEVRELMSQEDYEDQFRGTTLNEINLGRLLDGDIDGFLEDELVGATMLRSRGLHDQIQPHNIMLEAAEVHVMFSRESVDSDTVERFNHHLQEILEDGTYEEILRRYTVM